MECMDHMKTILAYAPQHELALEYIQQSEIRMKEIQDADKDRRWIIDTEQKVMTLFKSGDIDGARREAHRLEQADPDNKIAKKYLAKEQPSMWRRFISRLRR